MSMPRYDCRMLSAIGKYLFHITEMPLSYQS